MTNLPLYLELTLNRFDQQTNERTNVVSDVSEVSVISSYHYYEKNTLSPQR